MFGRKVNASKLIHPLQTDPNQSGTSYSMQLQGSCMSFSPGMMRTIAYPWMAPRGR